MRRYILAVLLLIVGLTGINPAQAAPAQKKVCTTHNGKKTCHTVYTLTGTITAPECEGGYKITNATVVLRDQDNRVLGAGTTSDDVRSLLDPPGICKVSFEIQKIRKALYYQIKIGTHEGPVYSFSDLKKADWDLTLSLG